MENKLDGASLDIEQMERERLKVVFPQCFIEGKLDIDKLLNLCGEYIDNDFEKYKFEWHGKGDALKLAQRRSMGTLRPCVEDSVAWDTTENLYIEGDNLEVLKLLQTAYYRRVKMIYIDPPYNTGNDFVYEDDFKDPINRYKEVTSQTTKSNPETMGRFHTNWLNMIYPRLRLAANLLTDDGVIFISIDDNEIDNLKKVCNEVFGEENFVAQIIVQTNPRGRTFDRSIAKTHEYVLVYSKYIEIDGLHDIPKDEKAIAEYSKQDDGGKYRLLELRNRNPVFNRSNRPLMFYPIYADPNKLDVSLTLSERHTIEIYPRNSQGEDGCWTWGLQKAKNEISLLVANLASTGKWSVFRKDYLEGTSLYTKSKALWLDKELNHENGKEMMGQLFGKTPFDFPKSVDYVKKCLQIGSSKDSDDIILDFFSGSGTTAHAVMQLNAEDGGNRKFICVQLPEVTDEKSEAYKAGYKNICEIGKERIRRAGVKVVSEQKADLFDKDDKKLDTGFKVFKLDTSNLKTWDSTPINSSDTEQIDLFMERLNGMVETIKADRTQTDMVYEVMLKMGIPLTYSVTEVEIGGKRAYAVGDECLLLVCLQEGLTTEIIETMASDYLPSKLVLSEKCFADDTAMANTHYILKEREIELKLV
ncbi:MAG: site-specific DNA-methyltransferase [Bacteroidales bacterium]